MSSSPCNEIEHEKFLDGTDKTFQVGRKGGFSVSGVLVYFNSNQRKIILCEVRWKGQIWKYLPSSPPLSPIC